MSNLKTWAFIIEIDILGIDLAIRIFSFTGSIVANTLYTGRGFS
ncbi:hypothetical protein RI103_33740 [Paraburkholderia sp. FT54]|nr:hypothetical protein [Paraburkholderia sp. FT54]WNC94880.1 hypothetical protein RI103_33740 [Paraburkholderia sp. FT54]